MSFAHHHQDLQLTVGLDQRLAMARAAVQDSDFQSETASQFMPKASQNCRNYAIVTKDVLPANNGSAIVDWNTWVTFKYGNEGYPNLLGAQLMFTLPRLVDAGAANLHPSDAAYAGAATFIEWQPFIGELLFGKADTARQRFSTETLRNLSAEALHIKRALCHDANGTAKRAAYNNSVKALATSAVTPVLPRLPVWLPHSTDDLNVHQIYPVQAFATENMLQFKMPTLLSVVRSDVATTTNIVGDPSSVTNPDGVKPQVFLRLIFAAVEKAERGTFANMVLSDTGLTYQTMHVAREPSFQTTNTAAHTVTIPIKNSTNPNVFIAFVVRYIDDLKSTGDTAQITDTNTPPRAPAGTIRRPNYLNFQEWNAVALHDGGGRIKEKYSKDELQNCVLTGLSQLFPCDIGTKIGVIPFSLWPSVENHGLGHISMTSLVQPTVRIDLPAVSSKETGATRQIDLFYFHRNWIHMANGAICRTWNEMEGN